MNPFYNKQQKRFRAGWRILFQFLFYLTMSAVGGLTIFIIEIVYLISTGKLLLDSLGDPETIALLISNFTSGFFFTMNAIVTLIFTLVVLWISAKWIDKRKISAFGFHFSRQWWQDLIFGLLLGILLMGLIFVFEWLFGWIEVKPIINPDQTLSSVLLWIFSALIGFICVGIYEEILFRGFLLRNLAEGLNSSSNRALKSLVAAFLLSSLIFGLFHILNPNTSWISTLNIILAGLFLGLGFVLTGELAIPIGLHITWNFFQGSIFGFPVSGVNAGASLIAIQQKGPAFITGGSFGPEAGLIGIFAMLLGSLLIMLYVKYSRGKVSMKKNLAIYNSEFSDQHLQKVVIEGD